MEYILMFGVAYLVVIWASASSYDRGYSEGYEDGLADRTTIVRRGIHS